MGKIGIITLTKNANHGNVLQNMALQMILQNMGHLPETIINKTGSSLFKEKIWDIKYLIKWIINHNQFRDNEKRNIVFRKFCQENIEYSQVCYDGGTFYGGDINQYDYFITGSDQVWNPEFGFATDFEMLRFAPMGKRISYAASFGVSNLRMLSKRENLRLADSLNGFQDVSVREESGKQLINSLCSVRAYVHLDPTMLISKEEWEKKSARPGFYVPKRYVLLYMLGDITKEYRDAIQSLANKHVAVVINVLDGKYKLMNPLEFIWMIQNAQVVCTDSFHAVAFSVIFNSRFYVFERKDQYENQASRFDIFFNQIGIKREDATYTKEMSEEEINWGRVNQNLKELQFGSIEYLLKKTNDEKYT